MTMSIFEGKGDIMNYGINRCAKLIEHAMKIVENINDKRMRKIGKIDDKQFNFIRR